MNMTQEYITPEGKVDMMLFGRQVYNDQTKRAEKQFVTDHDGTYPAKTQGIFDKLYIPNDMGYVIGEINKYLGV